MAKINLSKTKALFFIISILLFQTSGFSFAQQEESLELITKSQYFSIYGYSGMDIGSLLAKLNFNYSRHIGDLPKGNDRDLKVVLAKTMDAIFLEASDILDIHIYSFHGTIKILPDKNGVNSIFSSNFGMEMPERSFYFHDKNTIYISFKDITLGMLAHEVSHAIVSHYFVVPPPAKVQEVLCGYVEYTIRKSAGTLP